jgi:hypothetical protein
VNRVSVRLDNEPLPTGLRRGYLIPCPYNDQ